MRFYRRLYPLAALTFDLDDTLYDNCPVIRKTEQKSIAFLQDHYPQLSHFQLKDLHRLHLELCEQDPEIYHDVTRWRWCAIYLALSREGVSNIKATMAADAAMQNFALWRSQIKVPEATHATLRELGERYPLVAITNGNANPALFGLGDYFQFVLRAGPNGRAKPYRDMYQLASNRLEIEAKKILHVGDNLTTDISGALQAGFQACWIKEYLREPMQKINTYLLPHLEISRLASLVDLL